MSVVSSNPGTSKQSDSYASQGTPPNSPAAASIFSKVMGAATGSKQAQGSGNPLGIAAVLLQGAQAGNGKSNSNSSGSIGSTNSQNSQTGILSSFSSAVHINNVSHRHSATEEPTSNSRRASNLSSEVEDGKEDVGCAKGSSPNTKLTVQQDNDSVSRKRCSLI